MSDFNCNTDFCKQCGLYGGFCKDCVKKKCYEQGKAEAVEYLVSNGYIRYGFGAEYLLNQMEKIKGVEE